MLKAARRGISLDGLEKKRFVLRHMLKNCLCVPVVLRNYNRINQISEELDMLREEARRLRRG